MTPAIPKPRPPNYPEEPENVFIRHEPFTRFERIFWGVVLLAIVFLAGYQFGLNAQSDEPHYSAKKRKEVEP